MNSFVIDWLMPYIRQYGPTLGLRLAKEAILPYLQKQAAESKNKIDDYFVRQAERILSDPEFVALVEGIG